MRPLMERDCAKKRGNNHQRQNNIHNSIVFLLKINFHTFACRARTSKKPARLSFHVIQLIIIVRWLVMKEYQFTHMRFTSGSSRHLYGTMPITMLHLLIIMSSILRIVDQKVSTFNKCQEVCIIAITPLHVRGINDPSPCIFDAINDRAITRMTLSKFRHHPQFTLFLRQLIFPLELATNYRSSILLPDNTPFISNSMKSTV